MKTEIYTSIANLLGDIKDENNNPVFKHFNLWNRQVEFLEKEIPFLLPAVFVEFENIQWKTLGGGVAQEADVSIKLHVVSAWRGPTGIETRDLHENLSYLNLTSLIFERLQNKAFCRNGGFFTRVSSETDHDHEKIIHECETYVGHVVDNTAVSLGLPVSPGLSLKK